jgi:5-methyltetrahydrofolate--homocysteine methyltransferase
MLKTRGYRVVDLGKNVPAGMILDAAFEHDADVVGLSALMTSTAPAMGDVIRLARERGLPAKIIVGGAVVTPEFARSIGADGTSPDAVAAVRLVDGLLGKS